MNKKRDYYKPKRVSSFWNNNYIEYERFCDKNNNLLLVEYLNNIKPYLKDLLIDIQSSATWKIQLTIAVNFISSKDNKEQREMYSTSDNIKFTSYRYVIEVVNEIFESLLTRYQNNLEVSMRGSEFTFNAVQLLCCKFHKMNFKCGR